MARVARHAPGLGGPWRPVRRTLLLGVTAILPACGDQPKNTVEPTNPVPVLASLSPDSVPFGDTLDLIARGSDFLASSVIRWDGTDRTTSFVSQAELRARVSLAGVTAPTTVGITVFSPPPGGGTSASRSLAIVYPAPVVTAVAPFKGPIGDTLTVSILGSGFVPESGILWNGAPHATVYVNRGRLDALLSTQDLADTGDVPVAVRTPTPGGGTSTPVAFSRVFPAPVIVSITPTEVPMGTGAFTLEVHGDHFFQNSVIVWNDTPRPTTYVSRTLLTTSIAAAEAEVGASVLVKVMTPPPGGGETPNRLFLIKYPAPVIDGLSPDSVAVGEPSTSLTLRGSGFVPQSSVRFWSTAQPYTYVSPETLTVLVPAESLVVGRVLEVSVLNPAPGGGLSDQAWFTVLNPVPTLDSMSIDTVIAGRDAVTADIYGTGFTRTTEVLRDTFPTQPGFASSTHLLTSARALRSGPVWYSVRNPSPGGGRSDSIAVAAVNPVPTVSSIDPESTPAGYLGFLLFVDGNDFTEESVLRWDGVDLPTTFQYLSAAPLRRVFATIPQSALAAERTVPITVWNPPPGGGESSPHDFTISARRTSDLIAVPVHAGDMVYDSTRGLLWASAIDVDSVVGIDPNTGAITAHIGVGDAPLAIAMSSDAHWLYVGMAGEARFQRIDLTTLTVDLDVDLARRDASLRVNDVVVPTGVDGHSVVVALRYYGRSPSFAAVVMYDDAQARPIEIEGREGPDRLAPSSMPGRLYGNGPDGFRIMWVDGGGVHQGPVTVGLIGGPDMVYEGGRLYGYDGRVIDPDRVVLLGTMPPGPQGPDAGLGRDFVLTGWPLRLEAWSTTEFTRVDMLEPLPFEGIAQSIVRWGPDGLAIADAARILIFRSNVVGGTASGSHP